MLRLLIICLLFTSPVYSQEIELEDLDDLSILNDFDEDEAEIVGKKTTDSDESILEDEDDEELSELSLEDDDIDNIEEVTETKKGNLDKELEDDLKFLDEEDFDEDEITELDTKSDEAVDAFDDIDLEEMSLTANKEIDEEVEFKYIEEFSNFNKNDVDKIVKEAKERNKNKYTNFELEALKVQVTDIVQSSLRLAYIPRGAKLTRLKDGVIQYTTKPITVRAYSRLDFNKNRYIINKDGKIVYTIYYQHAADIRKITNLYRKPHKFVRYPKKIKSIIKIDKEFPISLNFNLHGGISIPTYSRDLLDGDSTVNPLVRIESVIMSQKKHQFNVGLSTHFETTSGTLLNGGTYRNYNLSTGPQFKFNDFWGNIALIIQPRLSLFSQMTVGTSSGNDVLKLSETNILSALEIENKWKNFGHISFGLAYQRKWINTSTQEANYSISDASRTDDSIALYIGHRSDWIW